jgi:hypothetical protein
LRCTCSSRIAEVMHPGPANRLWSLGKSSRIVRTRVLRGAASSGIFQGSYPMIPCGGRKNTTE